MKHLYIKKYVIVLTITFLSLESFCQNNDLVQSINSSGNDATGNSGSISYSVGQVFYSYIGEDIYHIAQGVQHGHNSNIQENTNNEDSDIPDDATKPDVKAIVHPNPTSDFVTLTTEGFDFNNERNSYQLYNYQGRLLSKSIIQNQNSRIDLSNLSTSIYILQVFAEEKLLKTFKILKQ